MINKIVVIKLSNRKDVLYEKQQIRFYIRGKRYI